MKQEENIKGGFKQWFIGTSVGIIMRLYSKCLSYEFIDVGNSLSSEKNSGQPYLFAFWHDSIIALGSGYRVVNPEMKMACLTSASKDGALIEAVMAVYGIKSIRGSSSRRGKRAMIEMLTALKEGYSISITPDGPRGPRHKLNPGVVRLASRSGVKVVPVQVKYSSYKALSTWDKFKLPLPFCRVTVLLNEPLSIPLELSEEQEEEFRLKIEETLISPIKYIKDKKYAEHRW